MEVERAIEHLLELHARAEARMDRAEARMDRMDKQLKATADLVRGGMKLVAKWRQETQEWRRETQHWRQETLEWRKRSDREYAEMRRFQQASDARLDRLIRLWTRGSNGRRKPNSH
jgi:hypothetical protein